jgi:WXG100 family type VII secretion target
MANIRVSPERLRNVASSLDRQQQEIDNLLHNTVTTLNNLDGNWTGLAYGDYAQMFHEQVPSMRAKLAETLEHLVNELRRIADEFERTDQEAVSSTASPVGASVGVAAAAGAAAAGVAASAGSGKEAGNQSAGSAPKGKSQKYQPRYDGTKPAPGMDSTYGKPGQLPLDAPVTSNVNNRSVGRYQDVINQFGVGNNPRYTADGNYTYCNTFAGDVARAMEVPLPQKREFGMNPKDKATIGFPQMWQYFTDPNAPVTAASDGWREANNLTTIKDHVNDGKMAVAVNDGHIAVIRPGQGEEIKSINDLVTAQAGATNSNDITLGEGFGSSPTPKIFIID